MVTIKNIALLSKNTNFLKYLLTFDSCDKVHKAFLEKGVNISVEDVKKIRNIIYDLEENEDSLREEDREIIYNVEKNISDKNLFDSQLYNFYYDKDNDYPSDFFLKKSYYDGEIISSGIFTMACMLFNLKKKCFKSKKIWDVL